MNVIVWRRINSPDTSQGMIALRADAVGSPRAEPLAASVC
jgi:hypothetical protein